MKKTKHFKKLIAIMLCLTMVFSCLVPVMADTNNNLPYPEFGVEYYEPTYYLSEEYAFSNSDWYYQTGLMPAELLVSLSVISPVIEDIREAERRVLYLVNIERASYGLAPLVWYDGLADVSRAHSQDMVDNNFFSHTGSDGSNVGTRLTRVGISHRGWAENIASARSPESAMEAWMNSPGHRANILQDGLTHLGVGAVGLGLYFEGIEFHVWTQKFIWGFLVTSVSITGPATHTLTTGQFLQLEASVAPTNATNRSVIWSSSNPAVATVTGSGLVSGVSAGNATIAVTTVEGGHVATVAVTVEGISVTGVSIDGADTRTLTTGYTLQLNANVAPANATNRSVIWSSSNPAVATVTGSGLISGVSAGNATITVTTVDGGHVATVAVTVEDISVTGVSIDGADTRTLTAGYTLQLNANVAPTNATNRSVIWSSSNPAVATVTGSGLVSGVSAGNATIMVTTVDGGHVATVAVTVEDIEDISVTGVSIGGADTRTLTTGYTLQLNANVAPTNATNRSVIWSSSNPAVATVTESGLVSGVSAGNATIMVTTVDGGHVATVAVTVEDIEDISVTGVSIDGADTRTLITGYTLQLNANVAPANATNRSVIWSSNNPVVATVTESGLVSGVSVGNAIITVTTVDGGYVASVTITVEDGEITPPTGINITVDTNRNVTVTAPESVIYRAYGDRPTVTGSVYVIFPPGTDRNDITVNLPSGWSWAFEVDPDTGELIVVITPRANVGGTGPGGGGGGGGGGGTATPPAEPTTPGVVTLEPDVTPDLTVPIPLPFNDVAATAWYYNYVRTVWENSIFQGTAHNQFSPQMGMTRAMFVQALANLEGVDLTVYETASPTFNDLPSSAGHFAAVEWAAGQGIVQGVGNDNFAPNASITMEQMATMLYRYIQIRGIEIPASQTNTFADFDAISYWAVDAVEAIQAAGIITGRPNGNFDPRTTAIRAEVTAIFARFLNVIEEDITNIEEIEETEEVEEIDE